LKKKYYELKIFAAYHTSILGEESLILTISRSKAKMKPTPTDHRLPKRKGDFDSLSQALDYAAAGETGYNFYDGGGNISAVLPFKNLQKEARSLARRLLGLGPKRGARVGLVAETHPDFIRYFFACQYAGLVPVPLPASIHLDGRRTYIEQLQRLLVACKAEMAIAPEMFLAYLREAAESLELDYYGSTNAFVHLPEADIDLEPSRGNEPAYLQYSLGNTRIPRGVMITQQAVMNNLAMMISGGIMVDDRDRIVSWLPFYHDTGLVEMMLAPLAAQVSVDYLYENNFLCRKRRCRKNIDGSRYRHQISRNGPANSGHVPGRRPQSGGHF
jgi:fatty-acyl-CoA synthase